MPVLASNTGMNCQNSIASNNPLLTTVDSVSRDFTSGRPVAATHARNATMPYQASDETQYTIRPVLEPPPDRWL